MRLDRRIVFQRRLDTKDDRGQRVLVWSDVLAGVATGAAKTITDLTQAGAMCWVQCASHGFHVGQLVTLTGVLQGQITVGVISTQSDVFAALIDAGTAPLTLSSPTATPVTGVPASIEATSSRERLAAQALDAEITHRIVVRANAALDNPLRVSDMRALHVRGPLSRYFSLQPAIARGARDHYLEILANEGMAKV